MKQLGLAFEQYKNDYDMKIPGSSRYANGTSGTLVYWPTMIFDYVKNEQIYVCPSTAANTNFGPDPDKIVATTKLYCGRTTNDGSGSYSEVSAVSYGRNQIENSNTGSATGDGWATTSPTFNATTAKFGFVGPNGGQDSITESRVEDPAGTIHMFDSMAGANGGACGNGSSIITIRAERRTDRFNTDSASKVAYRHFDGFNALYGDGHVKWQLWGTTRREQWSVQAD